MTVLLWGGLIIMDSAAQLLFKSAAIHLDRPTPTLAWVLMVAQSWRAWTAGLCLLLTFGFWMLILRHARLSSAFPVTALTFAGVCLGSWMLFGESITMIQAAGIVLIIGGVALLRPLDA